MPHRFQLSWGEPTLGVSGIYIINTSRTIPYFSSYLIVPHSLSGGRETNSVSNIDLTSISGSRSLSLFLIIPNYTTLKRVCQEESGPFSKYFSTLLRHSTNSSNPSGLIWKPPSIQYSAYISFNSSVVICLYLYQPSYKQTIPHCQGIVKDFLQLIWLTQSGIMDTSGIMAMNIGGNVWPYGS